MSAPASTQETSSKEINSDFATRKTELKQMTDTASNNKHSKKILYNTLAVYIKIIFNSIITLIATRIVLDCLGANDFGLYNLLAGVILLLSFMNGSLMISTQRYLSVAIGEGKKDKLVSIFNASMTIHLLLALCVLSVLLLMQPILINEILNIPDELKTTAHIVYDIMVVSSAITLLQVPYSAEMNAHQDIYYWAFTEAINCFLRFLSAVALFYIDSNKLEWYSILVLLSLIISALIKLVWCRKKYNETELFLSEMKNKVLIKEMFGFVGWNTLGSSAVLVRNQGVAVILNMFFGTIVNAAYGIANQVNGLVMTLASTITTVFAPSIMQAHGAGDDEKMMKIATMSSKLSFFISSITAIPLIVYMQEILELWLKEIPEYTVEFCTLMIMSFIILQLTAGVNRAIYAVGKIKNYQILITLVMYLIIPVGYLLLKLNFDIMSIFCVILIAQLVILAIEIIYIKVLVPFNISNYVSFIIKSMVLFIIVVVAMEEISVYSKLLNIFMGILYVVAYYYIIFNKEERNIIYQKIKK